MMKRRELRYSCVTNGVGKSIKLMNKQGIVMNNYFKKTIAGAAMLFVLGLVSATATAPSVAMATEFGFDGGLSLPDFSYNQNPVEQTQTSTNQSGVTVTESGSTFTECVLEASSNLVTIGESIDLSWYTSGFSSITVNGQAVSSNSGTMTVTNLQNRTIFTLQALNQNGASCFQQVTVDCVPPEVPKLCELLVQKTVNKTTAVVGEELTYTITVKNIGDANCSGSGVMIRDVVDPNLTYLRHTLSSNLAAGYGTTPVYTSADRTLHFNGDTLVPNESGTITWVGKVQAPSQCGDFEVKNQAKATAYELSNYQTWKYSPVVTTAINNDCVVPQPPVCTLLPATQTINYGSTATLTWTTARATTATLTDVGSVALNGSTTTAPLYANKTYTLSVVGPDGTVSCVATVAVNPPNVPVPVCDLFTATPATMVVGATTTLTWNTSNATQVFINNGIGAVAVDGSISVSPLATITYQLTAIGAENKSVTCTVPVTVVADPKPVCEYFTATPNSLPVGGGNVNLNWKVLNAKTATISPTIGAVTLTGTKAVSVTNDVTYALTAVDDNGDEVRCEAPIVVADPAPLFTCANNVTFTASDSSIRKGDSTVLSWSTKSVDSLTISGISTTALSGSQSVSPSSDTTYTLTAKSGTQTINCPLAIDVSSGGGGGGGGSVSPRCELTVSDKRVRSGEKVTIEWDTSNATEVTLLDDRGKVLFTTDDYLSADKKKYYDHEITVKPTRDTEYTLIAERSSRDEECSVKVAVDDEVVVLQTRDQEPLIAGISLSQVPYTGFEAGPFMTILFYLLLIAWSLYITYLLTLRKRMVANVGNDHIVVSKNEAVMHHVEATRPDLFVKTTVAPVVRTVTAPENLPTGPVVVGYENSVEMATEVYHPQQVSDAVVTDLENRAHSQKALLSSDAVRHFVATTNGTVDRHTMLDEVIAEAKKTYPLEDGWIVVNESRMRNLCTVCQERQHASSAAPFIPATIPEGSGSLAEAIVTGNIVAAYQMIGNRPMFALADAAADLDAVYRNRRGGKSVVSEMLTVETKKLSDEQLKQAITALTGALDGTYTSEEEAVKMAIMKAVKAVA
jgi:uncharacterized repeat protein (TIGR01451 family)